jgi:hypothetical protein
MDRWLVGCSLGLAYLRGRERVGAVTVRLVASVGPGVG